jgi:hypothetical protein
MKILLIMSSLIVSLTSAAEAKWSFCAVETPHEGIFCSNARFVWSSYLAHQQCKVWANQQNLPLLSTFTLGRKNTALAKQREVCDSLPGKGKWQCFVIEDCGTTSSISPIDTRIFAPSGDTEEARDECVRVGWKDYKDALINVNHGCKIAPDAVEMMF